MVRLSDRCLAVILSVGVSLPPLSVSATPPTGEPAPYLEPSDSEARDTDGDDGDRWDQTTDDSDPVADYPEINFQKDGSYERLLRQGLPLPALTPQQMARIGVAALLLAGTVAALRAPSAAMAKAVPIPFSWRSSRELPFYATHVLAIPEALKERLANDKKWNLRYAVIRNDLMQDLRGEFVHEVYAKAWQQYDRAPTAVTLAQLFIVHELIRAAYEQGKLSSPGFKRWAQASAPLFTLHPTPLTAQQQLVIQIMGEARFQHVMHQAGVRVPRGPYFEGTT